MEKLLPEVLDSPLTDVESLSNGFLCSRETPRCLFKNPFGFIGNFLFLIQDRFLQKLSEGSKFLHRITKQHEAMDT